MEKLEGLSCLSEEFWNDASGEVNLSWQFGPGSPLDVDTQNVNIEESCVPVLGDTAILNDCKKASDSELEWQWIMDHQQTYKSEWLPSNYSDDSKIIDDSGNAAKKEQYLKAETDSSIITSSLFSGSKTEVSSNAGTSNASKVSGNLAIELNTSKSSRRDGSFWRTADGKELADLVSQKGHRYLENCDLPPSQSSVTRKGPLASLDLSFSIDMKSGSSCAEDHYFPLLSCRQESIGFGNRSLPSSEPMQLYEFSPSISEPQPVPLAPSKSFDNQSMNRKFHDGRRCPGVSVQGFEALGEALCHSQTRARQAEKLAAQALEEREKFARLLFRESWTARTYKHWVQTLELENMWLKMCSGIDTEGWMVKELSNISSATGQRIISSWKHCKKLSSRKKMHHPVTSRWEGKHHTHASIPENGVWLRCTIGLAFALGLSFAGAGLMIGWSMGWILPSH